MKNGKFAVPGADIPIYEDWMIYPEFRGKPSERSQGRVIVCCQCGCADRTLYRHGNKYICRICREKGGKR